MLAPIIVFAYNRPDHITRTLSALAANKEAKESQLFVFIDGPKKEKDITLTKAVYDCVHGELTAPFGSVEIVRSEKNNGLAKSIINGVTQVINKYGRAIVLEDDSMPSEVFLSYMNEAIDFYEKDNRIWSIGAFFPNIEFPSEYQHDTFLAQRSSSCAWACWADRWNLVDWDVKDYNRFKLDMLSRRAFNRWGNDRSSMLDDQMKRDINSWAIRFDYAMFKHGMYTVLPKVALIENIGFDGSGIHCENQDGQTTAFTSGKANTEKHINIDHIDVNESIRKAFCKPYHMSAKTRFLRYLSNQIKYR